MTQNSDHSIYTSANIYIDIYVIHVCMYICMYVYDIFLNKQTHVHTLDLNSSRIIVHFYLNIYILIYSVICMYTDTGKIGNSS